MNKRRLYAKTKTFSIFKKMFLSIVYKLEMEYWVLHCGTDGYLYLFFQRQMFKLSIYLSVIIFLFSFFMNFDADEDNTEEKDASNLSLVTRVTLSNRELSNNKSWFHVLMVTLITFFTISFMQSIRNKAREAHALHNSWQTKSKDAEQLKYHTIHIKGIPPEDRTGNGLRVLLDKFLAERGGSVIAVQTVPPFHNMIQIETKTRDLKYI